MSGSDSKEQQPDVQETDDHFLSGMAKLRIKEAGVKDLDDEQCKTPTRPETQIRVLRCPPAPRKKRPTPSSTPKRIFTVHYIIVLQETIDAFFQQASGQQSTSGSKRSRIN